MGIFDLLKGKDGTAKKSINNADSDKAPDSNREFD